MTTPGKEEMARELSRLTLATRRLCALHQSLGLAYPKSEAFSSPVRRPACTPAAMPIAAQTKPAPPATQDQATVQAPSVQDIALLRDTITHCERCPLGRRSCPPLFGTGKEARPALLIIGDAASPEGMGQGRPFAGQAGDLLIKMLAAIKLGEKDVFLANIIRCAIEKDKVPLNTQLQNCRPYLLEQINLFQPAIICSMGQLAGQTLIGTKNQLGALRGRFHHHNGIPLIATYHPNQLIQVPELKKAAWYDLQLIQHKLQGLGR